MAFKNLLLRARINNFHQATPLTHSSDASLLTDRKVTISLSRELVHTKKPHQFQHQCLKDQDEELNKQKEKTSVQVLGSYRVKERGKGGKITEKKGKDDLSTVCGGLFFGKWRRKVNRRQSSSAGR